MELTPEKFIVILFVVWVGMVVFLVAYAWGTKTHYQKRDQLFDQGYYAFVDGQTEDKRPEDDEHEDWLAGFKVAAYDALEAENNELQKRLDYCRQWLPKDKQDLEY